MTKSTENYVCLLSLAITEKMNRITL